MDEFSKLNTSIIACATESYFTYLKWFVCSFQFSISTSFFDFNSLNIPLKDGSIHDLRIPLMADKSMAIAKKFGVLNEEEGIAYRFVLNNYI